MTGEPRDIADTNDYPAFWAHDRANVSPNPSWRKHASISNLS